MVVYDTFMFRNEFDVLQMRLEELDPIVDWFVLVEAPLTFMGEPKPLHFQERRDRVARWLPKIRHVIADDLDAPPGWGREHGTREYCGRGLWDAKPDDLVLHGDVDEIPSHAAIHTALDLRTPVAFEQRMFQYAVDWFDPERWRGTIAGAYSKLDGFQAWRGARNSLSWIAGGGMHFTKLGSVQDQMEHVRTGPDYASSLNDGSFEHIRSGVAVREGWHCGQQKLIPVDVDDSYPAFIRERRCPDNWFRPR